MGLCSKRNRSGKSEKISLSGTWSWNWNDELIFSNQVMVVERGEEDSRLKDENAQRLWSRKVLWWIEKLKGNLVCMELREWGQTSHPVCSEKVTLGWGFFSEEKGEPLRVAIIRFASIPEYSEHGVENGLEGETQIDAGCPLESYCPQLGRNWPRMRSNRGKNNCFFIHSQQYCMQLN